MHPSLIRNVPPSDQIDLRSISLLRTFFTTILVFALAGVMIPFISSVSIVVKFGLAAALALSAIPPWVGLWLLGRGAVRGAVWVVGSGLVLSATLVLITTGLEGSGAIMSIYAIPVVIAGVLLGGRGAAAMSAASVAGVVLCAVAERLGLPIVGVTAPTGDNTVGLVVGFVVVLSITAFCVSSFGGELRRTLDSALAREQELEEMSGSLEQKVAERTSALQGALDELAERAVEQGRLLDELAQQRRLIDDLSLPILPVGRGVFVLPLVGEVEVGRMALIQQRALAIAGRGGARHLILDVSGVPMIDTQVAQGLISIVRGARLVGLATTLVGIRPEVAQSLVSLGVDLQQVRTVADLESALAQIDR